MKKSIDPLIGELVLYKNNQLIAFNKPAGLPVQQDKTGDKALLNLAEIYVKHPLNIIHRLDRPASGCILFAQTKNALTSLNAQFQNREVGKTYLAVISGKPDEPAGKQVHYIKKNHKINRSLAFTEPVPGAKEAVLEYELIGSIDNYHLLQIELITGRHHQIRAQLAAMDLFIKGDVKYGSKRGNPDRSIHLHAWKLSFFHPVSRQKEIIVAPVPSDPVWEAFDPAITARTN